MLLGITAVILLYVSAEGMISITYPWLQTKSSDQIAHIDMIYRVYNGDLPKATDGVRYQPFIENGVGNVYQRASGHPPLFHALMAPFMGPLLNKGEWKKAIAVGRAMNIFLGILTIFALAWAGWLFGGKRKALFAVAVPALAVLTYRFSRVNTDLSMDILLTLLSTLTIINLYKILQGGLKIKYLAFLALLSVAGMATKASYGALLGLSLGVVVWASYIYGSGTKRKRLIRGSVIAAGICLVVIAAIGWYYYLRNYKTSGSLLTPLQVDDIRGNRSHQSYFDIFGGSQFWSLFYARLTTYTVVSTIITIFAVAGYFAMKKVNLLKAKKDTFSKWAILLLFFAFLGVVITQIKLAYPYGSINFRYLLPAILPISLFLAYGLLEYKWLKGQLVALAAMVMAWATILSIGIRTTPDGLLPGIPDWWPIIAKIYKMAATNDIPAYVTSGLFSMFIIGSVLLCVAMLRLGKTKQPQ